jgi:hypothetical protein
MCLWLGLSRILRVDTHRKTKEVALETILDALLQGHNSTNDRFAPPLFLPADVSQLVRDYGTTSIACNS